MAVPHWRITLLGRSQPGSPAAEKMHSIPKWLLACYCTLGYSDSCPVLPEGPSVLKETTGGVIFPTMLLGGQATLRHHTQNGDTSAGTEQVTVC